LAEIEVNFSEGETLKEGDVRVENNGLSLFYFYFSFLFIFLYFLLLTKGKEDKNVTHHGYTSHMLM